jgi:hypothetical protein
MRTPSIGAIGATGGKRRTTEAGEAAKEIRQVLKAAFPGQKFEVSSKNYTGGNSVTISYENGPTQKEVERYVRDFEYGRFDAMTDMYNITNRNKNIPQVKYLFVNRYMSKNLQKYLEEEMAGYYNNWDELKHYQKERIIYDQFKDYSMTPGISGIYNRIKNTASLGAIKRK